MDEKILNKSKNGMPMLLLILALYAAAIGAAVIGGINGLDESGPQAPWGIALFVIGLLVMAFGWILFCGLKYCAPRKPWC